MEVAIKCPCPVCGFGIQVNELANVVFETIQCPSCKASLVLKYDELVENGEERPIWWFETAS